MPCAPATTISVTARSTPCLSRYSREASRPSTRSAAPLRMAPARQFLPVQGGELRERDFSALQLVPEPGTVALDDLFAVTVSAYEKGVAPARPAIDPHHVSVLLRRVEGRPQVGPIPHVDDARHGSAGVPTVSRNFTAFGP